MPHVFEHLFVFEPAILHADLDSFYASVEQRDDPRLRGRPVIVGGGVVLAASYEAKAYGVRTAMGGGLARRMCPQAVVVPPRFAAYTAASRAVFEVFRDTTPAGRGHLDRRGVPRRRPACGGSRARAGDRRAAAAGGGRAGRAADHRRGRADEVPGQGRQPRGQAGRPAGRRRSTASWRSCTRCRSSMLWGVGQVTAAKLHGLGVRTVAEVAELGEPALVSLLGPAAGRHLHALAHRPRPAAGAGRAPAPVDGCAAGAGRPAPRAGRGRARCWPGSSTG